MIEDADNDNGRPRRSRKKGVVRRLRKEAVSRLLTWGMHTSQRSGLRRAEVLGWLAQAAGRSCLPLRVRLARNMRLAGVYRRGLVDDYFRRAGDQLELLLRIFAAGWEGSGVAARFQFDESFKHVEEAHRAGRGVLIAAPHLCCYPLIGRVISDRIPCSIYLRHSVDRRKHGMNQAIAEIGGAEIVFPPDTASRSERLTVALRILREGKLLYVTPDLIRKPEEGTAVTILGRAVWFPTGVPIMAMRTGAPIIIVLWNYREGHYHLRFHEPVDLAGRGERAGRVVGWVNHFAQTMDSWLREYPEMWWNWLDKRWTWLLRGGTYPNAGCRNVGQSRVEN